MGWWWRTTSSKIGFQMTSTDIINQLSILLHKSQTTNIPRFPRWIIQPCTHQHDQAYMTVFVNSSKFSDKHHTRPECLVRLSWFLYPSLDSLPVNVKYQVLRQYNYSTWTDYCKSIKIFWCLDNARHASPAMPWQCSTKSQKESRVLWKSVY